MIAPISRPVKNAFGVIEAAPLVLIDVATDQGITGRSYIFGYAKLTLAPPAARLAGPGRLAVTPTAHRLEVLNVGRAILAEPIAIVDGAVTARGPGLGLVWDEAAVAKYSV